jgi:hypothetical protein
VGNEEYCFCYFTGILEWSKQGLHYAQTTPQGFDNTISNNNKNDNSAIIGSSNVAEDQLLVVEVLELSENVWRQQGD